MRALVEHLNRLGTWAALLCTAVLMVLSSADALGRYLFDLPIEGAFQISEDYLLVLAVFLGLGYSYQTGSHVRVTFVVDKLAAGARRVAEHAVQWFSLACALVLAAATGGQAFDLMKNGARSNGLVSYPLWPAHFCVFFGCLMLALLIALDVARVRHGTSALQATGGGEDDEIV